MSPGSSLMPPTKGQQMQHKCRTNSVWMHAALLFRSISCISGRGRVPVVAQRVLRRLVPADKTPLLCSPSGFDLPQNPRRRGEERWIAAARPSASRRRKEETNSWINGVCLILLSCLPPVSFYFVCTSLSFSADGVFWVKMKVSGQTAESQQTNAKYKSEKWIALTATQKKV